MFLKIIDVTLATTRTILLTKGKAKTAAVIGFFEIIVYIKVLADIVSNLDKWYFLVAYAVGFSLGNYIGSLVEQKLAFGDVQIRLIIAEKYYYVIDELRALGFGVTSFNGEGRDGERKMILITAKRKKIDSIYSYLAKNNIEAFVSINDITSYKGGYFMPDKKKGP